MKRTFTKKEMKDRAIFRVAEIIQGQWEEGGGVHSRIFEVLVPDEFVVNGQSRNGGGYREHVVPCSLIRNHANVMFENDATIEEVASMINRHLRIVIITTEEAKHLDQTLGLKEIMPKGWQFGSSDPLARLHAAGIELL
jgi:hypothetical protein